MRAGSELPVRSDPACLPWSRHAPTPWRAVHALHIAVACDGDDSPKPLVEGLTSDGHRAFWSTRNGLTARLGERHSADGDRIDLLIVSARLLSGADGGAMLTAICETCAGASLLVLGADVRGKAALVARLERTGAFERVLALRSPVDLDDLRMLVMNAPRARTASGFRARIDASVA